MKDEGASPPRDLRRRTREFAGRVMRLGDALPRARSADVVARQIIRAGTSVGAHYRESLRARSNAEVISKLEGALQELEETVYWLEVIIESDLMTPRKIEPLLIEADELTAILVSCVKKVKARAKR